MNLEKHIKQLEQFQQTFNSTYNTTYTDLPEDVRNLRINMFDEEAEEFLKAFRLKDEVEMLDGLCDMFFLTLGDAVSFGVQNRLHTEFTFINLHWNPKNLVLSCLQVSELLKKQDFLSSSNSEPIVSSIQSRLEDIFIISRHLYGAMAEDVLETAMDIVWASNMSKLGDDGKPVINGEKGVLDTSKPLGKILKSSNYWEPTEKLKELLATLK